MAKQLDLDAVLPMLFERTTSFENLWNLYIAVAAGLVVLLFTMPSFKKEGKIWQLGFSVVLLLVFSFFTRSNMDAMISVLNQRYVIGSAAVDLVKDLEKSEPNAWISKLKDDYCGVPPTPAEGWIVFYSDCIAVPPSGTNETEYMDEFIEFHLFFDFLVGIAILTVPFARRKQWIPFA